MTKQDLVHEYLTNIPATKFFFLYLVGLNVDYETLKALSHKITEFSGYTRYIYTLHIHYTKSNEVWKILKITICHLPLTMDKVVHFLAEYLSQLRKVNVKISVRRQLWSIPGRRCPGSRSRTVWARTRSCPGSRSGGRCPRSRPDRTRTVWARTRSCPGTRHMIIK